MMTKRPSLLFGIPSLDELIELPFSEGGNPSDGTSITLLGPDGTGKSVLALHLASRYHFECMRTMYGSDAPREPPNVQTRSRPVILYISSDLKHTAANSIWEKFKLNHPGLRHIPFERTSAAVKR